MTAKDLIFFNDFVDFVLIETSEDNTDNDIDFDQTEAFPDDIETINIEDVIDIPSNDSDRRAQRNKNINNQLKSRASTIRTNKKKYQRQKSRGYLKKANKKVADFLRRVGHLDTDGLETID